MGDGPDGLIPGDPFPSSHEAPPLSRPIIVAPLAEILPEPSEPILLLRWSKMSAFIDIVVVGVLIIAADTIGSIAIAAWKGINLKAVADDLVAQRPLILPGVILRAFAAMLFIGLMLAVRGQTFAHIGLNARRLVVNILLGLGTGAGLLFMGMITSHLVSLFWPELLEQLGENAHRLVDILPRLNTLQSAVFMLMVGGYEEIVFRGFVMPRLRRLTGSWIGGVLISTAIFSALHLLLQVRTAVVVITILSIIFSLLTIWRKSLVPAIVAHFLFNFVQMLILNHGMGRMTP